jgi:hypothetical protein
MYCRGNFVMYPPTYRSALGHASPCAELIQVSLFPKLKGTEHEGDILGVQDGMHVLTLSHAFLHGGHVFGLLSLCKFDLTFSDVVQLSWSLSHQNNR